MTKQTTLKNESRNTNAREQKPEIDNPEVNAMKVKGGAKTERSKVTVPWNGTDTDRTHGDSPSENDIFKGVILKDNSALRGTPTSAEIRRAFLDFFAARGHTIVPSASLVPQNDPTLLFTNAGMNQFKDVFLGTGTRPYRRAADTQRCMRVAGKHNDLEDVGRDGTHHTLFEMLGNWSFGDYYKEEAITWAWELLTRVYGLPAERLWVTVFEDDEGKLGRDEETAEIWREETTIDPSHILFFGRKDNFWAMGETGPCGPCSEIHFDRGPEACDKHDVPGHVCRVNGDCQRYIELWNLVFIQYNLRHEDGTLDPLPARHVDTGMGLERLVAVLQGTLSNYRTDLFWPIILQTQAMAGQSEAEREANIVAYRVIADHIRAATFLIGDGVLPANEGRGYVLRMILRRAVRFGRRLGFTEPFLAPLSQWVIETMGDPANGIFPELPQRADFIKATITAEEHRFLRTLDRGLEKLEEVIAQVKAEGGQGIPGEVAFFLHDTFGLPLEVTRDVAEEYGLGVDEAGYHQTRERMRRRTKGSAAFKMEEDSHAYLYPLLLEQARVNNGGKPLQHDPYGAGALTLPVRIVGMLRGDALAEEAEAGDTVEVVLSQTNFYAESGGQVSDKGLIVGKGWEIAVENVHRPVEGLIVHVGKVLRGRVRFGDEGYAEVNEERRLDTARNHTATHLLHKALREVLGEQVAQAGSLVTPDRLRFDFNAEHPLTSAERDAIERIVNAAIRADYEVATTQERYANALKRGAIALFGEKYGGDESAVRVVRIGPADAPFSLELCGGTHVRRTGQIGAFVIVEEHGIGANLRRIEAVTGKRAVAWLQAMRNRQEEAAKLIEATPETLIERLQRLQEALKELRNEQRKTLQRLAHVEFEALLGRVEEVQGVPVLIARVETTDVGLMREMTDWFRDKVGDGIIVLGAVISDRPNNGGNLSDGSNPNPDNKPSGERKPLRGRKPFIIAATTEVIVRRGVNARELVRALGKVIGGGGGGRPCMAQAGGRDTSKLDEALARAKDEIAAMLTR